ncbi:MAG TPA: hypothetical protein VFW15_03705, partial [Thermoanaerobaculia bacterium]|nr:hypothetical protein [Thermoanaerobaculia bacterium]
EIGLNLDEIPLVLQYNKRDLANLLTVEELEADLNRDRAIESYEASAILGQGVFETLKAISRITLRTLKKRMVGEERPSRTAVPPPPAARPAAPPPSAEQTRPAVPPPIPAEQTRPAVPPPPVPAEQTRPAFLDEKKPPALEIPRSMVSFPPPELAPVRPTPGATDVPAEIEFDSDASFLPPEVRPSGVEASSEEIADVSFAQSREPGPTPEAGVKHVRVGSNVDILAELERLRKNATSLSPALKPTRRAAAGISVDDLLANSLNHRKEVSRVYELDVPRRELASGEQISITLRFQDRNNRRVGEERTFSIPLESQDLEKLLLSLKFQIFGK